MAPSAILYDAHIANLPGFPPLNVVKAEEYLRAGAESGIAPAQYFLALELLQGPGMSRFLPLRRNPTQGMKWLDLAGKQGYGPALVTLARIYGLGEEPTVAVNFVKARGFVEAAAAKQQTDALLVQGGWYLGSSVYPKNEQKAFACFEQAARLGDPGGCEQLGRCYEGGIGIAIAKQFQKPNALHDKSHFAYHWYMKAMEFGGTDYADERLKSFRGIWRQEQRGIPYGSGFELEPSDVVRNWENALPENCGRIQTQVPSLTTIFDMK